MVRALATLAEDLGLIPHTYSYGSQLYVTPRGFLISWLPQVPHAHRECTDIHEGKHPYTQNKFTFKDLLLFIMCRYVYRNAGTLPGTGVMNYCEPADIGAGN